jgi:hypothetical protein
MIDQENKWNKDTKGEGKVRNTEKIEDYTFSDIDLDNVFRYYLADLAAKKAEIDANNSLTEQQKTEELEQFRKENDPMLRFGLNKYLYCFTALLTEWTRLDNQLSDSKINEAEQVRQFEDFLTKNEEIFKFVFGENFKEKFIKDGKIIKKDKIQDEAEKILNPMRMALAERYEKEGLNQPRYPMDTPILNKFTAGLWFVGGVAVFIGIIMVFAPTLPLFALIAISSFLSMTFVAAKFAAYEAEKAEKRIAPFKRQ